MKGIILAGGSGTRLFPITKGVSKQMLPIYDKPTIYYPLSTLMLAGIRDILIITTPQDNSNFQKVLGDGSKFGIKLFYAVQEEPKGIAQALLIGEDFIKNDSVALILGDNVYHGSNFSNKLKRAKREVSRENKTILFGYQVHDPNRYGVAEIEPTLIEDIFNVLSLEEKPENPKSNVAVTGLYMYPKGVVEIVKNLKPSKRGELEITDLNKQLDCTLVLLDRGYAWFDTGTFDSFYDATSYVMSIQKRQGLQIACPEEIAYNNGWITKEDIEKSIKELGNNSYKEYLEKLIR